MKIILTLLIALTSSSCSSSAPANTTPFSNKTKIFWRLEVTKDGKKKAYEEEQINSLPGLKHPELKISCASPLLTKEHIKYHPKKNRGYTRDEERSQLKCTIDGTELTSELVVCAKGYAKNKVGNKYSDQANLNFKKEDSSYSLKLSCVLK